MLQSLSAHDRRHLVSAYTSACERTSDNELRLAALLHDIGKATLSGRQISLATRVLAVLTCASQRRQAGAPHSCPAGSWFAGMWLAEHHARIGADRLRALGIAEEICWLVEHHGDAGIGDGAQTLLRDIDHASF